MLKTRPAKETVIRMLNEIGSLDQLAKTIADKGVNILAVCAWVEGKDAVIRLVTDDPVRVMDAVRARKYEARTADVLVSEVPHKPGMLHRISETLLQDRIDIHHLYATAAEKDGHSLVVFGTANNDRAMVLLNSAVS